MSKQRLILVCAPWGSGSSAVAGVLANSGLLAPKPYFLVTDSRTPISYEMDSFVLLMKKLVSENSLHRRSTSQTIIESLTNFSGKELQASLNIFQASHPTRALLLKHATTSLILPEICEVFDTRIVGVLRPLVDIEATRRRRKWPSTYGSKGASIVYKHLFSYLVNSTTPFHLVRYSELLEKPQSVVESLSQFCGIEFNPKAIETIRRNE